MSPLDAPAGLFLVGLAFAVIALGCLALAVAFVIDVLTAPPGDEPPGFLDESDTAYRDRIARPSHH